MTSDRFCHFSAIPIMGLWMQNEVPAPAAGRVVEVRVKVGQLVETKDTLVVLG